MIHSIIRQMIYGRVKGFIERFGLIRRGDRVLLSLSAGKDSMALLDIMLHLKESLLIEPSIFHLNHLARGAESDGDERFLSDTADTCGLKIFIERHDFSGMPAGASFEDCARRVRYGLLEKIAGDHGFGAIATAHSSDDNVETILMRIMRGTGVHGLSGIPLKRGKIIRPLLCLSSREIINHLKNNVIPWREDSSNQKLSYSRNYVRHELLPRMRARFHAADDGILHLGALSGELTGLTEQLLFDKYGNLYECEGGHIIIPYERFEDNYAVLKFAVSLAVRESLAEYVNGAMLDELIKNMRVNKTHMLLYRNSGIRMDKTIRNGRRVIAISRRVRAEDGYTEPEKDFPAWEYTAVIDGCDEKNVIIKEAGIILTVRECNYEFFCENCKNPAALFIDIPRNINYIIIRNRRKGDRIRFVKGLKKLKELFIENKLDIAQKENIPLIVVDSAIAAAMIGLYSSGFSRVSVDFLVKENSEKILAIYRADA